MNKPTIIITACVAVLIACVVSLVVVVFLFIKAKNQRASGNSKIVWEDPSNVLFSSPTFCNSAPATERLSARPSSTDFILHEDNWRQVEFVPLKNEPYLANLVEEVSRFEQSNRVDVGWKEVFVRKEHPTPINTLGLSFKKLLASMQPHEEVRSALISSSSSVAKVRDGFSFVVQGLGTFYGQQKEDVISELAFEPQRTTTASAPVFATLSAYCKQNQLLMVDWYQRRLIDFDGTLPSWVINTK